MQVNKKYQTENTKEYWKIKEKQNCRSLFFKSFYWIAQQMYSMFAYNKEIIIKWEKKNMKQRGCSLHSCQLFSLKCMHAICVCRRCQSSVFREKIKESKKGK